MSDKKAEKSESFADELKEAIKSMIEGAVAPKIKGKVRDAEYERAVSEMSGSGDYSTNTKRRDNEVR